MDKIINILKIRFPGQILKLEKVLTINSNNKRTLYSINVQNKETGLMNSGKSFKGWKSALDNLDKYIETMDNVAYDIVVTNI